VQASQKKPTNMAQYILWNWQDDDSTKNLNHRSLGINEPGRYRGFAENYVSPGGMVLRLEHDNNGFAVTKFDTPTYTVEMRGVILTKQGVVIHESEPLDLPVAPGDATHPRIDLVVCEQEYVDVPNASNAIYYIIQGTPAANPIAPAIPAPGQIKLVIGTLYVPAGTTALTDAGVIYTPTPAPNFANDAFIMKTNLVQTSTMEKTFSLYGGTLSALAYDNSDPLAPYLKPATADSITNIWRFPNIDNAEKYVKNLWLSVPLNSAKNKGGRIHYIFFEQDCRLDGNGNILFPGKTPTGYDLHLKVGDWLTIVDLTDIHPLIPPGYPAYLVINGADVSYKREAKWQMLQSWNQQLTSPVVDVDKVLQISNTGNYAEVEFDPAGAEIRYLPDLFSRSQNSFLFGDGGGAFIVLKIVQAVGANNIVLKHNAATIFTAKAVLNTSGGDLTLNNGDMLFLVEGKTHWNVVAAFTQYGNPYTAQQINGAQAIQISILEAFKNQYTGETWKLIGSGGNMANSQPVPNFNAGAANAGTGQVMRLRKTNEKHVHLQGHITHTGITAMVPFAIILTLPIGYRPLNDIYSDVNFKDSAGNVYAGIVVISSAGVVIIQAANGVITGGMGTVTWSCFINELIPID